MTTGTTTTDLRTFTTTDCGGPGTSWFGIYGTKTWNGGDRVPGEDPDTPHPYQMSRTWKRSFQYQYRFKNDSPGQWKQGCFVTCGHYPTVPSLTWTADQEYKLIAKLRRKVQGGDFNFAVFLGEGHAALSMIADTATRVGRGIYNVKRGNFVGAAKALFSTQKQVNKAVSRMSPKKDVAGNWLALQYGWLPLYSDVHDGAEKLSHHLSLPAEMSFRVTRKCGVDGELFTGTPPYITRRYNENWRRMKKQIIYTATEDWGGLTIPQILGLEDPEIVAWELVPFSFVADWFIPIGNWLTARAFAQKLKGKFVVSLKDEWLWKGLSDGSGATNYCQFQGSGKNLVSGGGCNFTRTVSTSYANVPKPEVHGLGEALSWRRAANAVALLVGIHGSVATGRYRAAKGDAVKNSSEASTFFM